MKSVVNNETILLIGGHYEILNPGTGQTVTKYYFAGASRIAMRKYTIPQSMTVEYFLGDHLGSTSITTDNTGAKASEMRYEPWGEVRYSWTANQSTTPAYTLPKYSFTGQYSHMDDPSTAPIEGFGLMFYRSRFYDPQVGRFSQADSIVPGGVQGLDRYAYVNNSPVMYVDPSGHEIQGRCNYLKNYNSEAPEEAKKYEAQRLGLAGQTTLQAFYQLELIESQWIHTQQSRYQRTGTSGSTIGGGGDKGSLRNINLTCDSCDLVGIGGDDNPAYCFMDSHLSDCYMQGWENFEAAWNIVINPNTPYRTRQAALGYMAAWGGAHAVAITGTAFLACSALSAVCFAYGGESWHVGLQLPGELSIIHIGNSVRYGLHIAFGYVASRAADLHIYFSPDAYIYRPGWEEVYFYLENAWRILKK